MKKVLITGNMGYVGPVLVSHLRRVFPTARLIGYDSAFFAQSLTTNRAFPERFLDEQRFGDVRDIGLADLEGCDVVVNLAAISNDPMGNRFEVVTEEINQRASVAIAQAAAAAKVKNFVFASSCSVYGFAADGAARKETDQLNPLTAYAKSKIGTEKALREINFGDMIVTSLRFATACGYSDRLRLDLVLNDFVACALSSGEITVLSDGSPWRPLIDVSDMARAIEWASTRTENVGGSFLAVNVGADEWNFQVKELAEAVAAAIPNIKVSINADAPPDKRSYKVDFGLFRELAPNHQPKQTLGGSIAAVREGLQDISFADPDFRNSPLIRLKVLDRHLTEKRLSENLRWL